MTDTDASPSGQSPKLPETSPSAIRDELVEMVFKDLLGPTGGLTEELDQSESRVTERYLIGMLAPKAMRVPPEAQDDVAAGGDDDVESGKTEAGATPRETFFLKY